MRIYVKPKEDKNLKHKFGYRELAEKMWFKEKNGKELEISHIGNDQSLRESQSLTLRIDKWLNDSRWNNINNIPLENEDIDLGYQKKENVFIIVSSNIKILTVDERALCIMVIEVAKSVEGEISEDRCKTWISLKEFEDRHQKILSLTYDEANEISLKEVKTLKAVEEPYDWIDLIDTDPKFDLLTQKKDIDKMMSKVLSDIDDQMDQALKSIAQKEECGGDVSFLSFKKDFDEFDMSKMPKQLDDKHILAQLKYPEVEVDQLAYLDFKTFYEYMAEKVHEMIDEDPSNKYLLPLLADVKKGLGV